MAKPFEQRFTDLADQAEAILAAKKQSRRGGFEGTYVDPNALTKWQVNARHLLSMVCGRDSEHYAAFEENQKSGIIGRTNHDTLLRQQAVFLAAKDDYEGGYLTRLRDLIQAEYLKRVGSGTGAIPCWLSGSCRCDCGHSFGDDPSSNVPG